MPLPNELSKEIFSDILPANEPTPTPTPEEMVQHLAKPAKQKPKRKKYANQAEGKVSVTFFIHEATRDKLQSYAFMTRQAQNHVVEDAVETLITKSKIELPQR
jgi:hypothetical protein